MFSQPGDTSQIGAMGLTENGDLMVMEKFGLDFISFQHEFTANVFFVGRSWDILYQIKYNQPFTQSSSINMCM